MCVCVCVREREIEIERERESEIQWSIEWSINRSKMVFKLIGYSKVNGLLKKN